MVGGETRGRKARRRRRIEWDGECREERATRRVRASRDVETSPGQREPWEATGLGPLKRAHSDEVRGRGGDWRGRPCGFLPRWRGDGDGERREVGPRARWGRLGRKYAGCLGSSARAGPQLEGSVVVVKQASEIVSFALQGDLDSRRIHGRLSGPLRGMRTAKSGRPMAPACCSSVVA